MIDQRLLLILADGYDRARDYTPVRGLLVEAQEARCGLCGEPITRNWRRWQAGIDHVWPKARGGYDGPGNMIAAHRICNVAKDSRFPTGCEIIVLIAVNERLGIPTRLKPDLPWLLPDVRQA